MTSRCDCNVEKPYNAPYCQYCANFLRDAFLIEPSPENSPLREIIWKIYKETDKINGEFLQIDGGDFAQSIFENIEKADICFCDVSQEIFNVFYEIGYALGYIISNWSITAYKKNLTLLKDRKFQDGAFNTVKYISSLPRSKTYIETAKIYRKNNGKITRHRCNKTIKNKIIKCDENISTILHQKHEEFFKNFEHIFGSEGNWDWKKKEKEQKTLFITDENLFIHFNNINKELYGKTEDFVMMKVDDIFCGGRLNSFIKKIITVINSYDYLIIHLIDNDKDQINAGQHNSKVGMIAGFFEGCRRKTYDSVHYIINKESSQDDLRCSDVPKDKIRTYNKIEEAYQSVEWITKNKILSKKKI